LIVNFKARQSKGKELAEISIEASELVSTAKGCHLYNFNRQYRTR